MAGPQQHPLARVPYTDILARIERLRRMDAARLDDAAVAQRVKRLLDGYTTNKFTTVTNALFRARKNPDRKRFSQARELWYPPVHLLSRPGRLSGIGQQMFYACSRYYGAIWEIGPEIGDMVTVLVAGSRDVDAQFECAHIGLERCNDRPEATGKNGVIPRYNSDFRSMLIREGIEKKWLRIDDYLSDVMTERIADQSTVHHYKITNAIANIMFDIEGTEAISYPSVAANLNCVNSCLLPLAADRHFVPVEVWEFDIVGFRDSLPGVAHSAAGFFETRVLGRSDFIDESGTIHWANASANHHPSEIGRTAWQRHAKKAG